jgi:hypothetical protein
MSIGSAISEMKISVLKLKCGAEGRPDNTGRPFACAQLRRAPHVEGGSNEIRVDHMVRFKIRDFDDFCSI